MATKGLANVIRILIDDHGSVNYYYELSVLDGQYIELTHNAAIGSLWTVIQPAIIAAAKAYATTYFGVTFGLLDSIDFYRPYGGI